MNQNDIQHEADGGMRLVACVVLTALAVIAFVICGCASSKPVANAAIMPPVPNVTQVVTVQPVRYVCWNPQYEFTNEVTVIQSSADLVHWRTYFVGMTNQCTIQMASNQMFFRAYNMLSTNVL